MPRVAKPSLVILTRRLNSGEPIPSLPSWIETSHNHQDYQIKEKRLNQMIQSDYINSQVNEPMKVDSNLTWMDKEDYNLNSLFEEKLPNDSVNKSNPTPSDNVSDDSDDDSALDYYTNSSKNTKKDDK